MNSAGLELFIPQNPNQASFQEVVEEHCGERVSRCYQCGKCSAGCPLSFEMDYKPNQIMKMIQLGMEKQVLSCRTIWLCASALACTTRCPRGIDIAEIMDYLRRRAYQKKIIPEETEIPLFNKIFLRNIESYGRLYEAGLIGMFNLCSGGFFKDILLAPKMFLKQKIGVFPWKARNLREVRNIFKRSGKLGKVRRDKLFQPKLIAVHLFRKLVSKVEEKRKNTTRENLK